MKISVIGLWRNSTKHIQRTLDSLDNLAKLGDFNFYFYENDSIDNTGQILSDWLKNRSGELLSENIQAPQFGSVPSIERLVLLSYYRNKAKTLIANSNSEYTLLIDTDILFSNINFQILYEFMQKIAGCAMVVSNTRQYQIDDLMNHETNDSFYDVFALRDYYNNNGLYFTDCPFVLNSDREAWKKNQAIQIKSGFSGFALIKTDILKQPDCFWSTCGHSEHVNFCNSVNRYGNIYMLPSCAPKTQIDLSSINLQACKDIAKNQINHIQQINQIYNLSISEKINIK
jgi:hypothetical protein